METEDIQPRSPEMQENIDQLVEANPEALLADGFDAAYIGHVSAMNSTTVAVYDARRCVEVLENRGMTYDEALEFFDFNVAGAYVGESTPLYVWTVDRAYR